MLEIRLRRSWVRGGGGGGDGVDGVEVVVYRIEIYIEI
jgi:hypothetical protein